MEAASQQQGDGKGVRTEERGSFGLVSRGDRRGVERGDLGGYSYGAKGAVSSVEEEKMRRVAG